jgi:uncharacterized protein
MSRPFKTRCVTRWPGVTVFKPAGIPAVQLRKVVLHFDELEAIGLVDGQGLDQARAAESMRVSRPTVGRILARARRKIAHALAEGQALFIEHGAAPVQRRAARRKRGEGAVKK